MDTWLGFVQVTGLEEIEVRICKEILIRVGLIFPKIIY